MQSSFNSYLNRIYATLVINTAKTHGVVHNIPEHVFSWHGSVMNMYIPITQNYISVTDYSLL